MVRRDNPTALESATNRIVGIRHKHQNPFISGDKMIEIIIQLMGILKEDMTDLIQQAVDHVIDDFNGDI
jgi:hypothetical protein